MAQQRIYEARASACKQVQEHGEATLRVYGVDIRLLDDAQYVGYFALVRIPGRGLLLAQCCEKSNGWMQLLEPPFWRRNAWRGGPDDVAAYVLQDDVERLLQAMKVRQGCSGWAQRL